MVITFRGGKADEHRMSTDTLARVFQAISSDIENVYRVVSYADVDITSEEIKKDSQLYLSAEPAASSFQLHFISEPTNNEWIELSGRNYGKGLKLIGSGALDSGELPIGIGSSILQHAKAFSNPPKGEYETMELSITQDSEPPIEVMFDEAFGIAIEKQIVELKAAPPEIHGYEIEGILHALDDQDYLKPVGPVQIKVEAYDGDWYCEVDKTKLPMSDLDEMWKKRVFLRGLATFRPRKRTLRADTFEILPDKPSLLDAVDKFIEINEKMWEGQDPTEYLESIRERNK